MRIALLVLSLSFGDWSIANRLPFEESWRDPAAAWVNADYFRIYEEVQGEPWMALFMRNYLAYNPIRKSHNYGRGYVLVQDRECYEVADCTGDGATDLSDFAKFARFYHAAKTTPTKANDGDSRRDYPCSPQAYGPAWFTVSYDLAGGGGDD